MPHQIIDKNGNELLINSDGSLSVGPSSASPADGVTNAQTLSAVAAKGYLFNGTTWDRARSNVDTTTGDTGAKVASFNGATQTNYNWRGAYVTVLCGTVSGTTPTLSAQFQWSFDGGTTWLALGPASGNVTASNNSIACLIYPSNLSQAPGATPANLTTGATATLAVNAVLPRTWRLTYAIGGTGPSFAITAVYVNYLL